MPVTEDERRRTQTDIIYKNGNTMTVISKDNHLRGRQLRGDDRAVVVGQVKNELMDFVVASYREHGFNLQIDHQGQVLTATELKRRQLLVQMEDLEKEENLQNFFRNINVPGVRVTGVNFNTVNRGFTATISGRFE